MDSATLRVSNVTVPVSVRVETVSIPANELVPKELGAAVELLQPYWSTASICTFLGSSQSLVWSVSL